MATTEYDFTKTPCDVARLQQEIQTSTISSANYQFINLLGTALSIFFDNPLSADDETTLSTIVTNHSGVPLAIDFTKYTATSTTSTNSASYVVLDSMVSNPLISGMYLIFFRANFSTNVPLLTNPGVTIAIFNNGTLVNDSVMTQISNNSGAMFDMVTVAQMQVNLNQVVDVRWQAANGAGNTISCTNRLLAIVKQK